MMGCLSKNLCTPTYKISGRGADFYIADIGAGPTHICLTVANSLICKGKAPQCSVCCELPKARKKMKNAKTCLNRTTKP